MDTLHEAIRAQFDNYAASDPSDGDDPEYGQDPCRGEHGASGYMNYGCRCEVCTAAHNHMVGGQRAARYAQRVLIDGRLVHPNATHGRPSTYLNWGCRCPPCTDAKRAA